MIRTLPSDYARCFGQIEPGRQMRIECMTCMRRLSWLADHQAKVERVLHMQAPIEYPCPERIAEETQK